MYHIHYKPNIKCRVSIVIERIANGYIKYSYNNELTIGDIDGGGKYSTINGVKPSEKNSDNPLLV